jgi:hypothetical protein
VQDVDGNGVIDQIIVSARRGKRSVSRTFPV